MTFRASLKTAMAALIVAFAAAPLSGCGFTPLYATPGVTANMAGVEVITPQGRLGHLLSEDLRDDLAIRRGEPPRYRLALNVSQERYARGLSTEDVATWYELYVMVDYSLVDAATGKTLTAGQMPVSVSYDAPIDPYAGIVAQQDGQRRAASEAAQRIRIALASYFAGSPVNSGPAHPPAPQ